MAPGLHSESRQIGFATVAPSIMELSHLKFLSESCPFQGLTDSSSGMSAGLPRAVPIPVQTGTHRPGFEHVDRGCVRPWCPLSLRRCRELWQPGGIRHSVRQSFTKDLHLSISHQCSSSPSIGLPLSQWACQCYQQVEGFCSHDIEVVS